MIRLAYNDNAMLVFSENTYFVINYRVSSINTVASKSKDYGSADALRAFEKWYGKAKWVRQGITT